MRKRKFVVEYGDFIGDFVLELKDNDSRTFVPVDEGSIVLWGELTVSERLLLVRSAVCAVKQDKPGDFCYDEVEGQFKLA